MDGKGRCLDNVFVERLWRSLKYEEVYLHAYENMLEARAGIRRYFSFYNDERAHQALGYQTPDAFYRLARHPEGGMISYASTLHRLEDKLPVMPLASRARSLRGAPAKVVRCHGPTASWGREKRLRECESFVRCIQHTRTQAPP